MIGEEDDGFHARIATEGDIGSNLQEGIVSNGISFAVQRWLSQWWEIGGPSGNGPRRPRRGNACVYLMHRITCQDDATKMPVLENTLFD